MPTMAATLCVAIMRRLAATLFFSCLFTDASAFVRPSALFQRLTTARKMSERTTTEHNFSSTSAVAEKQDPLLPTMIVFDLDFCLWEPEMYTLHAQPSIPVEGDLGTGERGVVGMKVPPAGPTVQLFPGARKAMLELATNPQYKGIILAAASSSEEPSFSYACLENIEVLPGLTLRHMFTYDQIGRTGNLTPDKKTHFKMLHQESQIPYDSMLFFDDGIWGDHVGRVNRAFGVIGQVTPNGLQYNEFLEGLEKYRKAAQKRMAGY